MAVWNPSGIVITEKGLEILSKVQLGVGLITISRVVSGSSRVPIESLSSLLSIQNEEQEFSIIGKTTTMNSSVITIAVDNSELESPYTMNQIGVYVTHQDYEGEVLYYVAQCDEGTADTIPTKDVSPVSLQFDLNIGHSNTDRVVINISSNGSLPITGGTITGSLTITGGLVVNGDTVLKKLTVDSVNVTTELVSKKVTTNEISIKDGTSDTFKVNNHPVGDTDVVNLSYLKEQNPSVKKSVTITLPSSGWSGNSQTVSVPEVHGYSDVVVTPFVDENTSYSVYTDSGIYCYAQGEGTLSFKCESVPDSDVKVNLLIVEDMYK